MKTTLFNRLTAGLLAAVLCLSVLAGCAAKPQKELTRYSTIFYDAFDVGNFYRSYSKKGSHHFIMGVF